DVLFRRLRSYRIEGAPYFSIDKIRKDLELESLDLNPDLLRSYLSEAMKKGVVYDAGRGWYSALEEPAKLDLETTQPLKLALAKRFPFLPHYVWSTQQLNPWMHHLLGKFVSFVYVERNGVKDLAAF